jgi:hypothetical protein
MKKKKEEKTKKFVLNKITIAQLDKDQIDKIKGGFTVPVSVGPLSEDGVSCPCKPTG